MSKTFPECLFLFTVHNFEHNFLFRPFLVQATALMSSTLLFKICCIRLSGLQLIHCLQGLSGFV